MLFILRCSIGFDRLMPAVMRPWGNFIYQHVSLVSHKHFDGKYPDKAKFFNDGLGNAIGCRRKLFQKGLLVQKDTLLDFGRDEIPFQPGENFLPHPARCALRSLRFLFQTESVFPASPGASNAFARSSLVRMI